MNAKSVDKLIWTTFAAASVLLVWQPVHWLIQSWTSPAYGSGGYIFVALIAVLGGRSLLSGPATGAAPVHLVGLLVLAAFVRFLSQTLAINLLGGLALAVDVFALVALLRLDRRPFALSPFWMAALFLFSLPVEAVLQRALGYPLQLVSAGISCELLGLLFDEVVCKGVRLTVDSKDVLVDLPCSGASGLLLSLAFLVAMNAIFRPRFPVAIAACAAVLCLAITGNSFRITLLAVGLVHDIDVLAEPMHSAVGIVTLILSLLPIALWYRPSAAALRAPRWTPPRLSVLAKASAAAICLALAGWIVTLPGRPVDVSRSVAPRMLPTQIAGQIGQQVPLSSLENLYFRQYGGQAQKAQFGPLGVNLVSTTSPLRHLHAPEACLHGLGYTVTFLGTRYEGVPSSIYRAEGPDGDLWRVTVSYVSDRGQATPSVGEAIWKWMNGSGGTWSSVQRITPWAMPEHERQQLEKAAIAALDIPQTIEGIM